MRWMRDDLSTRDFRLVRLMATLACASAFPSGCADTENHFIPAEREADAATSANDPAGSAGSSPVQPQGDPPESSRTDVGSGDPIDADPPRSQMPAQAMTPTTQTTPATQTTADAGSAPAPSSSGSGATAPLDPDDASAPDSTGSAPTDAAVATAPDANTAETLKCSLQFSACVLRTQPFVDECIDAFATCGDVVTNAADGSPEAMCAVRFTACVLDNPARSAACTEE